MVVWVYQIYFLFAFSFSFHDIYTFSSISLSCITYERVYFLAFTFSTSFFAFVTSFFTIHYLLYTYWYISSGSFVPIHFWNSLFFSFIISSSFSFHQKQFLYLWCSFSFFSIASSVALCTFVSVVHTFSLHCPWYVFQVPLPNSVHTGILLIMASNSLIYIWLLQ